ncbi:DUF6565 domain-containing protein [Rufibacter sediminis]|uniref:Uncharacterized protein n=1 Tax=Rufibacter sediminis TaxID=2762756 RepID=A0ABR6VW81_9BACT|nr:DUF6565 domain-containing protein [Rufibacter sediminis]MBC3541456.1 hypothetical protein [Rufibacter sediminis]
MRPLYTNLLAAGALVISLLGGTACERTSPNNNDPGNPPRTRAEEDLAELREWMKDKTDSTGREADTASSRRWPQVKEEFKEKTAQLDTRMDSLSEKSKAEYKELRRKYENWEARNQQRSQMPLQQETLRRFETEFFGTPNALEVQMPANQMRDTYVQFLQNVRARRANWTAADWDYVDEIYSRLNQKKDLVEDQLSGQDKLKIKALQAEYLTLETTKDAKDLAKEIKQ